MFKGVKAVKSLVMALALWVSPLLFAQNYQADTVQSDIDDQESAMETTVESEGVVSPPEEIGRSAGPQLEYRTEPGLAPADAPVVRENKTDVPPETLILPPASQSPYVEIDLARLQQGLDKAHRRSYGGSGGINPQVLFLDFEPLDDLVRTDVSLQGRQFNFKDNAVMLWGGTGYGGLGNGMRVGGAGWGNLYHYYSKPFTGTDYDSTAGAFIDSVVELGVVPAFGGFTVEKAFSFDRLHLTVGGILGGGALVVIKQTCREDLVSAFHGPAHASADSAEIDVDIEVAVAPFTLYGLQGGVSYSVFRWMHVGLEGALYLFHSLSGFGYGFDKFITVNPAVRLKIVFGNLG